MPPPVWERALRFRSLLDTLQRLFVRVHRRVRVGQQAVDVVVALCVVFDLADAEADGVTTVERGVAFFENFLEACHDRCGLDVAGASQQCDEFIAAQASDHIALTKGDTQDVGESLQRVVALGMAVKVVNLFEVVEVEKQQRRRPVQPRASVQRMLSQLLKAATVGQQRQLVHARHLHSRQLLLGHLGQIAPAGTRDSDGQHFNARGHAAFAAWLAPKVMAAAHRK